MQVPEQKEYSNGTEAVRCAEAGTNHCEKVNNQVCHTEVQRANITAAEIEQKCEEVCYLASLMIFDESK